MKFVSIRQNLRRLDAPSGVQGGRSRFLHSMSAPRTQSPSRSPRCQVAGRRGHQHRASESTYQKLAAPPDDVKPLCRLGRSSGRQIYISSAAATGSTANEEVANSTSSRSGLWRRPSCRVTTAGEGMPRPRLGNDTLPEDRRGRGRAGRTGRRRFEPIAPGSCSWRRPSEYRGLTPAH